MTNVFDQMASFFVSQILGLSITCPPFIVSFHHNNGSCFFLFFPRLSQEGLFNLLDNIEGRLHGEQTSVYGDSSIDGMQLDRIIRYTLPI